MNRRVAEGSPESASNVTVARLASGTSRSWPASAGRSPVRETSAESRPVPSLMKHLGDIPVGREHLTLEGICHAQRHSPRRPVSG